MVLKLGRLGQQIRITWKVLKCGAGEGWRRSVSYMKYENGRLTGLVTSYAKTAF
jgi:hypothetical protein